MNSAELMNMVLAKAVANEPIDKSDYEKDGILMCGKCHTPKRAWVDWIGGEDGETPKKLVPVTCECERAKMREEEERDGVFRFTAELKRLNGIVGAKDMKWTFADDDAPESSISKVCREYVEKWDDMRRDNMGILFFGSKGVGKTFYASCIVNAITEKQQTAAFVTTAELMQTIQATWEKSEIIDALRRFRLLVLDDLGAERDTSYSAELLYTIVDARYRAGKPTIVTTNIDLAEMERETDSWRGRIYDRVIEMCPITLKMDGGSRRKGIAQSRKDKARELLKGATTRE